MALNKKQAAGIGEFVQFAYSMFDVGGLQPPPDQGISDRGYRLVYWLNAVDALPPLFKKQKRFYGYLAISAADPGELILAIRGTRGAEEWMLDFLAIPVPFTPAPETGAVALGFLSIFDSFEFVDQMGNTTTLQGAITQLNGANPIDSIIVAGHSLGSALATLAAAELIFLNVANLQDKVALWTFASPAVGLLDFALAFDAAVNSATRVWNVLDIVPYVPPPPYVHVSGLGSPLRQSFQQLIQLGHSPRCEHILSDYLWLLDEADFPGDSKCVLSGPPSALAIAGAQRMRRAINATFEASGALKPATIRSQRAGARPSKPAKKRANPKKKPAKKTKRKT